ncbi:MAG TPA: bifunctional 2-C-methyl-D-erythritol 4-phosphate cytidylyltransferase/2-C-methyl-D-erythritol 2,4-cyclodiphosphate synthase [Pseudomonadales bacterium]|nr:bifunctional 2-C-methyl-D-erythritol 4-phosphate cytidylyltransferase/2-C-methyl-D-erythritol 2,4-cyclodiphosphate synthase [Pseudomonadales bacterium]
MSAETGIWAIIPAAGTGSRFGSGRAKQYARIGNATVLEYSISALLQYSNLQKIVVALHPDDTQGKQLPLLQHEKVCFVTGGAERADSVLQALCYLRDFAKQDDFILVHDAARPCLSYADVQKLIDALHNDPVGGILAVPTTDTLKNVDAMNIVGTVDRSAIWQAQTPQMFRFAVLLECLQHAQQKKQVVTDEASAIEACNYSAKLVLGSRSNIKITYPDDLALAAFYLRETVESGMTFRIGQGYDVHRFGNGDHIMLCGVAVPHTQGVVAHSDGDVAIHALCDALLGALALGDIGMHFPDTDAAYKNADSCVLLAHIYTLILQRGWQLSNTDITIIAEVPKVLPYREKMQQRLAEVLQVSIDTISVKATTTEKLGFEGRKEGIAAQAVVMLESMV